MSSLLEHPAVTSFDARVEAAFETVRGKRLADRAFYSASEAANHSIVWHVLIWLPVAFRRDRKSIETATKMSIALGIESALVNGGIKSLFKRVRPVVEDDRPHKLRQPLTSSFPSGHATSAMTAAAILSQRNSRVTPFVYGLGMVVAWSRVHVRIHHGSDVVAGLGIGAVLGAVAKRFMR